MADPETGGECNVFQQTDKRKDQCPAKDWIGVRPAAGYTLCMRNRTRLGVVGRGLALLVAVSLGAGPAKAGQTRVTVSDLQETFPDLPCHQVSADEFLAVTRSPLHLAQVVVPPATNLVIRGQLPAVAKDPAPGEPWTNTVRSGGPAAPLTARPSASNRSTSGSFYVSDFGSVDSRDAAIVVFVLAGVVVVAAAIIYSGALLGNLMINPQEAEVWAEAGPRFMFFSGGHQQGSMVGGTLALGLHGEEADVGLLIEGGYLDADVVTVEGDDVDVAGGYGMAGLTIRWPFDSGADATVFSADLLAGTASRFNLVSRAGLGLSWQVYGPLRAGLQVGAVYLDVKEQDGPVWQAGEDFNLLGGVETSVRF